MLEKWVDDFEAIFNNVKAKPYTPTAFIHDLRHKSKFIGIEEFKTEAGFKQKLYCHILGNNQGVIIERENEKIGPITSYGNISLEDFTMKHTPFNAKKEPFVLDDN